MHRATAWLFLWRRRRSFAFISAPAMPPRESQGQAHYSTTASEENLSGLMGCSRSSSIDKLEGWLELSHPGSSEVSGRMTSKSAGGEANSSLHPHALLPTLLTLHFWEWSIIRWVILTNIKRTDPRLSSKLLQANTPPVSMISYLHSKAWSPATFCLSMPSHRPAIEHFVALLPKHVHHMTSTPRPW